MRSTHAFTGIHCICDRHRSRTRWYTHVCSHCFCILGAGAERSHLAMFVLTVSVFWVQGPSEAIYPCLFSLFLYSGCRGRAKPSTHVCSHCFCILGAGPRARSHLAMFVLTVSVFWVQGPSEAIYPCLFSLFLYSGYRGRAKPSTHVCSHCFCILGTGAERSHLPMFVLTVSVFWVQGAERSHLPHVQGAERSHLPMFVLTVSVFWVQGPERSHLPMFVLTVSVFWVQGPSRKPSTHVCSHCFCDSGCRSRAKRSAKLQEETMEDSSNLISDEELRNRTRLLQPLLSGLQQDEVRNDHHTSEYDIKDLVVRRGQPFTITITRRTEQWTPSAMLVGLQFSFGEFVFICV
ncbi:hypothetical protein RRG08_061113 [Elysia crispata]|uniref:Transglutaminase N-terminal domain-containing protein n=1 Tax=Elysia crispata TaxID=231223 RepID=A0AAE0ZYX8_9GAST|nr:hypothetical protein RRG08_061113 [Elysia crispata]